MWVKQCHFLPPMTGNGKHTTKQKMVTGGWRPGGRGPENLLELFSNFCRSFPVWFFVLRISSFFRDSIWCYKILWSLWRFWWNPPLPSGKFNPIHQPKVLLLIPLNPINHPVYQAQLARQVLGFQSDHRVSTFRCAKMSSELQANLARHGGTKSRGLGMFCKDVFDEPSMVNLWLIYG